ncbi:MAG: hypothetical protein L3J87_02185, partial [Thermoplasmata archaeon]|nr:hypothetical protein [Thermoplasmata archaeon]
MSHSPRASRLACAGHGLVAIGVVTLILGLLLAPAAHAPNARVHTESTGGGGGGGAGGTVNLTVNATDAPAFVPNGLSAPAGDRVAFHLVNQGAYNHTFTLSTNGSVILPRSLSPAALDRYFQKNGSWLNLSLPPGASRFANVTLPATAAGLAFEFVSLVPYQFQA